MYVWLTFLNTINGYRSLGHFLIDYFRKILIPHLLDIFQKDLYHNYGVNNI